MTFKIPKVNWPKMEWPKVNWSKINWSSIYKISVIEVLVLFTILFFTYTMPLTVNKFSRSFFGKLLILLSIGFVTHYKVIYGIVLAVLFIVISEIGYMESFSVKETADQKTADQTAADQKAADQKTAADQKAADKKAADKKAAADKKKKKTADQKEGMKGKDGMEGKKSKNPKEQDSKVAFIKAHCGAKRVNFDLQTIQQDYTGLMFSEGVCDPCDPGCHFSIDDTSNSLYNYEKNVHPVDKRQ
jgi:hypothetical protein